MLIQADLVHTPSPGILEILSDQLIQVDEHGYISHLAPATHPSSIALLRTPSANPSSHPSTSVASALLKIPKGTLLLPTFVDLHLHAPQFLYQGTGLDLPLMEWLDTYALKAEASLDRDLTLARRVYTRLARRLIEVGTGAVVLFGTIGIEANLILAECMQAAGVKAWVGKLSMDIDITPPSSGPPGEKYIEPSAKHALAAAEEFKHRLRGMMAPLPPSQRLVRPILTPRFIPTCSDELLVGLGEMLKVENEGGAEGETLMMQSHVAEARGEVAWVKDRRGGTNMGLDIFEKANLLTPHTILAHCTYLTPSSSSSPSHFSLLASTGSAIAHCPLSNTYFSHRPLLLREAMDEGVKVGLGTDIAGGYSLDGMSGMRWAVGVSRAREGEWDEGGHGEGQKEGEKEERERAKRINWTESLYLATRGGGEVLGLKGRFEVGAAFDVQEVRLFDPESGIGYGALDYFELEVAAGGANQGLGSGGVKLDEVEITPEMLEKWWCVGDGRNRGRVWVQGLVRN